MQMPEKLVSDFCCTDVACDTGSGAKLLMQGRAIQAWVPGQMYLLLLLCRGRLGSCPSWDADRLFNISLLRCMPEFQAACRPAAATWTSHAFAHRGDIDTDLRRMQSNLAFAWCSRTLFKKLCII